MNNFVVVILLLILAGNSLAKEITRDLISADDLRWNVPADGWSFKNQHLLKGKFFRISSNIENQSDSNAFKLLRIYSHPNRIGNPAYEINDGTIYEKGNAICEASEYRRKDSSSKRIYSCTLGSCDELISSDKLKYSNTNMYFDSEYLLHQDLYDVQCPLQNIYQSKPYFVRDQNLDSIYDFVSSTQNTDKGLNHYFSYVKVFSDKSYVEILINNKTYYLDISVCQKHPKNCSEINVALSDYEKDMANLKKHQELKDIDILNVLISELKPCVEKREVACIKEFFPDQVRDDYLVDNYDGYKIPKIEVNDELINELKACLDYKNLLPHLHGSRGVSKVCIFQQKGTKSLVDQLKKKNSSRRWIKLLNVTYPEAVRINQGYSIFLRY